MSKVKEKVREKAPEAKPAVAKQDSRVVALSRGGVTPPASMMAELKETSGQGLSTDSRDVLIPLLYVLQPLSPQISEDDEKYIEGAEAGDIYLRGAADPILRASEGDEPIYFQPCIFYKEWVEWIHRDDGGGFVGRHAGDEDHPPEGAKRKEDKKRKNKPPSWEIGEDHQLIFTRNHGGFIIRGDTATPYIAPMSSTGHAVSREFMRLMTDVPPVPGIGRPPSWVKKYRITTKKRKNARGEWYVLKFEDIGDEGYLWGDPEAMARGRSMFEAWKAGTARAEEPDEIHGSSGESDGDDVAERAGI